MKTEDIVSSLNLLVSTNKTLQDLLIKKAREILYKKIDKVIVEENDKITEMSFLDSTNLPYRNKDGYYIYTFLIFTEDYKTFEKGYLKKCKDSWKSAFPNMRIVYISKVDIPKNAHILLLSYFNKGIYCEASTFINKDARDILPLGLDSFCMGERFTYFIFNNKTTEEITEPPVYNGEAVVNWFTEIDRSVDGFNYFCFSDKRLDDKNKLMTLSNESKETFKEYLTEKGFRNERYLLCYDPFKAKNYILFED